MECQKRVKTDIRPKKVVTVSTIDSAYDQPNFVISPIDYDQVEIGNSGPMKAAVKFTNGSLKPMEYGLP